ncbi:MAG: ribosome maturation factor RimM [Methanosarcinales archaeon]|nr:ribosome maturation factor RimM [Methanosarcinales archaeon]
MSDEKILVGKINGIYGVKGWVKVFSHTDPRQNILSYSPWLLKIKGEWQSFNVIKSQVLQGGKLVVAHLDGLNDREIARTFMGTDISIYASQLEDTDEFYWRDLIDCTVKNQDDVQLGKVIEIVETGVHDVLRVAPDDSESSTLIPFVFENFIINIDIESKQIIVNWDLESDDFKPNKA